MNTAARVNRNNCKVRQHNKARETNAHSADRRTNPPRGRKSTGKTHAKSTSSSPDSSATLFFRRSISLGLRKTPSARPYKYRKNTCKVHLELTRLEHHAISRRSVSSMTSIVLTPRNPTPRNYDYGKMLLLNLDIPFMVMLTLASWPNSFLCDVIERKYLRILANCRCTSISTRLATIKRTS